MKVILAWRAHDEGADDPESLTLPAGLAWIAASLRGAGHEALVVNFSRLGWREVEQFLREWRPDLVGVSCFTRNRRVAVRLVRLARRSCPGVVTVVGGPHATLLHEALLGRVRELDYAVLGDGEAPLLAACGALARGDRGAVAAVPGIAVRGGVARVAPSADLDALPPPIPTIQAAGLLPSRDLRHVVASRLGPNAMSHRRPKAVAREVVALRDEFGIVDASLLGPELVRDRSVLQGLAAELVRAKAGVRWEVAAELEELVPDGPDTRDAHALRAALAAARDAGCIRVRVTLDARAVPAERPAERIKALGQASRELRQAGIAPWLTLQTGVMGDDDPTEVRRLQAIVRAFRPTDGRLELQELLPGTAAWRTVAEELGVGDEYWFAEARDVVPVASARRAEMILASVAPTMRDVARSARLGARDLAALESRHGYCAWVHLEWGDFRAAHGDAEEAARRYHLAASVEPWNVWPWLRLAALHARSLRPDPAREAEALREALKRVPRHEPSLQRLAELRTDRAASGRRTRRQPTSARGRVREPARGRGGTAEGAAEADRAGSSAVRPSPSPPRRHP